MEAIIFILLFSPTSRATLERPLVEDLECMAQITVDTVFDTDERNEEFMIELDGKRIVVTFLMHLGDVVLTTPFIHALRKLAPHSHITYVIDKKLADVYRHNPYIDALVEVDKKGIHNSIGGLNQIAKEIRQQGPVDVVINLHPNERTSYLAWKLKAKVTTGMSHFLFRPFMTKVTRLNRKTVHAAQMYMNVLEQLGYTVEHERARNLY